MKRLLIAMIVLAAFLGGYELGRRPGSPDVIGWVRRAFDSAADTGRQLASAFRNDAPAEDAPQN